jgi:single-stranded-DNA-specific exonuclease
MCAQFHISVAAPFAVAQLQHELNIPHFLAATLVARGYDTPDAAYKFMTPTLERDWQDPKIIPGLTEVVDTIERAIRLDKHIVVSGDFDLDGISATTVMTRGLRELGAHVTPFIPRRFEDGYGLSQSAFERIKPLGPDLLVTVDCGISCKDEVAAIVEAGCAVCVTDHHEAGDKVPVGVPVCDPKTADGCPSAVLAGVGVALKIVQELGVRFGNPYAWRHYTDFAALGTVADLMPMVGENRALVADGLERINLRPRPCLAALIEQSGAKLGEISSTNLSFSLVPRLNAAGRMGDAQVALDLLMCDDYFEAQKLAAHLEEINNERRKIEAELSVVAKEKAAMIYHGQRCLVVAGEGWHEGVKGIVASRLVNMYGVPAILFTIDGEEARGSGRSVGSVNLFAALEQVSDLTTQFGGHEAAVGVTLPTKNA